MPFLYKNKNRKCLDKLLDKHANTRTQAKKYEEVQEHLLSYFHNDVIVGSAQNDIHFAGFMFMYNPSIYTCNILVFFSRPLQISGIIYRRSCKNFPIGQQQFFFARRYCGQ